MSFPRFYLLYKDKLCIGEHAARRMVKRKDFPKIMVGSQPRIILARVDEYIDGLNGRI